MWQRIQTVYLVLAIIACLVCLCNPVAEIVPEQMGASDLLFNLWIQKADGTTTFPMFGIISFILLAATCAEASVVVFLYKNRKHQAEFCAGAVAFTVLWNLVFVVFAFTGIVDFGGELHPRFTACLPFVAMVLFYLARRAILKDEAKVRAADRIR